MPELNARQTALVGHGPQSSDDVHLIEAIASWAECAQGKQTILASLRHLSVALQARSVCLSRHLRSPVHMAQTFAFGEPSILASSVEVDRSLAACVLGVYIDRPRAGSLWLSSAMEEHGDDPAIRIFQRRLGVAETAVIALSSREKMIDYMEIHLTRRVSGQEQILLEIFANAVSRIWATRSLGLFSEAILLSRKKRRIPRTGDHLLSTGNPSRLSRTEYRICVLLSHGLNQKGVCDELLISQATLRAHLRSIFKKTETAALPELLFLLLMPLSAEREMLLSRLS